MSGNVGGEPLREMERLRKTFEQLLRPAGLRALDDYNKQILRLINPPVLRTYENYNKQIQQAIKPPALQVLDYNRQIQNLNRQIQKAINPPVLQALGRDYNKRILNSINPAALRSFMELSQSFSISFGPRLTEYAEAIGRSVVEQADEVPTPPGGEDEIQITEEWVPLRLTPAEAKALYWVFASTISLLAAGAAGASDEASRSLQALLGFMLFFLAVYSNFGKK